MAMVSGLPYVRFYDTKNFTWTDDGNSCSATLVEVIFERIDKNNYSTYRPSVKDGIKCIYPDGIHIYDLLRLFYEYKIDKDVTGELMLEIINKKS